MDCPRCGETNREGHGICTKCGQPLWDAADLGQCAVLPIHLKVGFVRREPWILWIGEEKSGLIHLGDSGYQKVTECHNKGLVSKEREAASEAAFISFAERLSQSSIHQAAAAYPGSVEFATAGIRELRIVATFDSETKRYNDYERFILRVEAAVYKGAFERKTVLTPWLPLLAEWLGDRYRYQTMEGFPFL